MTLHLGSPFRAVHIHNMPDALVLAGLIPKWMGAKLILDIHDPMSELYMSAEPGGHNRWVLKILRWQERWSRKLAGWIITVSEPMRTDILKKGVASDRVFVVHNFPDTRYLPVKGDIASWAPRKDRMVWLYAGTIGRQYGLGTAVRALKLASPSLPPITLRLVGGGNDLKAVLRLAEDLGVRGNVECFDPVKVERLLDFMKDADIGISCNQNGAFGDLQFSTKVLDYMTQGLPVVAARAKTMARYIPEDAVFYFEPNNAEDLAEKVVGLWCHPSLVRRKIANARNLFPRYTWQAEKSRLVEFYRARLAPRSKESG